ncbi:RNA polymerase sigma factor [Candidatus Auribacterota bacterium]
MTQTDQHEILRKEEIKEVFLTYKDMLFGFILSRVKNRHDAEDLFSKSFMKFFKYSESNEIRKSTLKSFLFTLASNTITDFFRRKKIIHWISLDNVLPHQDDKNYYEFFKDEKSPHIPSQLDQKESLKKINQTVSNLPDKQKEAFHLRFMDGFSFADIAKIQKTSVSTVLSRVRYGVNKIKDSLGKEMI